MKKTIPYRRTKQRELILQVLRNTDTHPTAEWIYEQVRREIPHVSLGTIYRNLKVMRERGDVAELSFGSGFSHFDCNLTNHYHFTCIKCGKIIDMEEPPRHKSCSEEFSKRTGFDIDYYYVNFFGKCTECRV